MKVFNSITELHNEIRLDKCTRESYANRYPIRLLFLPSVHMVKEIVKILDDSGVERIELARFLPFDDGWLLVQDLIKKIEGLDGWLISGSTVSRAKMFYDVAKNTMGIITMYDLIAMDEIQTIRFSDESELRGALKNYLESGVFTVANIRQTSSSGLILLGNIPLDSSNRPKNKEYFSELPNFFHDSALLDRFHGFIEGWRLPRINENLKVRGYTLNVEYFSEILHSLRELSDFASISGELMDIPKNADTRDTTAIKRLTTAYLKLLFPQVKSAEDINKSDFENFCLNPALDKRGIIRKQISMIDSEFKEDLPNIKINRRL